MQDPPGALPENGALVPSRTLLPPESGCTIFLISSGSSKRYSVASASLSLPQTLLKKRATCSKGRRPGRTYQKKLTFTAAHCGVRPAVALFRRSGGPHRTCVEAPPPPPSGKPEGPPVSFRRLWALGSRVCQPPGKTENSPQAAQWVPSMVWLGLLPGGSRRVGGSSSQGCGRGLLLGCGRGLLQGVWAGPPSDGIREAFQD